MRFINELKIVQQKNRDKPLHQLVRLLFHGSNTTAPESIALSENGLNINYAKDGLYGNGIYFADNAGYSDKYAHVTPTGLR
jgi:hypothetical protein